MNKKSEVKKNFWMRSMALFVAVVFTATSVSWNVPVASASGDVGSSVFSPIDKLTIPEEMGTISKTYLGSRAKSRGPRGTEVGAQGVARGSGDVAPHDRMVVLIQDAHAVTDAQENIRKILGHLGKEYGVGLAALEGAKGRMEPILFRTFPDPEVRLKILSGYEKRGELSGPEIAGALGEIPLEFQGMEAWDLYVRNYQAYLVAQEKKSLLMTQWHEVKKAQDAESLTVYDTGLKAFQEISENFRSDRVSLLDLLLYLSEFKSLLTSRPPEESKPLEGSPSGILRQGLPVGKPALNDEGQNEALAYTELPGLIRSIGYEKTGKQEALAPLVRKIADEFKTKYLRGLGVKTEMNFYNKYQSFMTGQIPAGAMLQYLVQIGKETGKSVKLTPSLKKLLGHTEVLSEIKGSLLAEELDRFLAQVEASLTKTPAQRELADKYRRLFVVKDLINLELNHGALMAYRENPEAYLSLFQGSSFSRELMPALDFYQAALERDQAFMARIEALMRQSGKSAVAVVAGGFHTNGLERIFKEKGFSYALVTPRMESLEGQVNYSKVMEGEVSFQKDLKTTYFDALMRHSAKLLAEALPIPERAQTLKLWRDNLIRELAKEGRIAEAGEYLPYIDNVLRDYSGSAREAVASRAKEAMLSIVSKELARFKTETVERLWKTFEFQLDVFTKELQQLTSKKDLSLRSVSALLERVNQTKTSFLAPEGKLFQGNYPVSLEISKLSPELLKADIPVSVVSAPAEGSPNSLGAGRMGESTAIWEEKPSGVAGASELRRQRKREILESKLMANLQSRYPSFISYVSDFLEPDSEQKVPLMSEIDKLEDAAVLAEVNRRLNLFTGKGAINEYGLYKPVTVEDLFLTQTAGRDEDIPQVLANINAVASPSMIEIMIESETESWVKERIESYYLFVRALEVLSRTQADDLLSRLEKPPTLARSDLRGEFGMDSERKIYEWMKIRSRNSNAHNALLDVAYATGGFWDFMKGRCNDRPYESPEEAENAMAFFKDLMEGVFVEIAIVVALPGLSGWFAQQYVEYHVTKLRSQLRSDVDFMLNDLLYDNDYSEVLQGILPRVRENTTALGIPVDLAEAAYESLRDAEKQMIVDDSFRHMIVLDRAKLTSMTFYLWLYYKGRFSSAFIGKRLELLLMKYSVGRPEPFWRPYGVVERMPDPKERELFDRILAVKTFAQGGEIAGRSDIREGEAEAMLGSMDFDSMAGNYKGYVKRLSGKEQRAFDQIFFQDFLSAVDHFRTDKEARAQWVPLKGTELIGQDDDIEEIVTVLQSAGFFQNTAFSSLVKKYVKARDLKRGSLVSVDDPKARALVTEIARDLMKRYFDGSLKIAGLSRSSYRSFLMNAYRSVVSVVLKHLLRNVITKGIVGVIALGASELFFSSGLPEIALFMLGVFVSCFVSSPSVSKIVKVEDDMDRRFRKEALANRLLGIDQAKITNAEERFKADFRVILARFPSPEFQAIFLETQQILKKALGIDLRYRLAADNGRWLLEQEKLEKFQGLGPEAVVILMLREAASKNPGYLDQLETAWEKDSSSGLSSRRKVATRFLALVPLVKMLLARNVAFDLADESLRDRTLQEAGTDRERGQRTEALLERFKEDPALFMEELKNSIQQLKKTPELQRAVLFAYYAYLMVRFERIREDLAAGQPAVPRYQEILIGKSKAFRTVLRSGAFGSLERSDRLVIERNLRDAVEAVNVQAASEAVRSTARSDVRDGEIFEETREAFEAWMPKAGKSVLEKIRSTPGRTMKGAFMEVLEQPPANRGQILKNYPVYRETIEKGAYPVWENMSQAAKPLHGGPVFEALKKASGMKQMDSPEAHQFLQLLQLYHLYMQDYTNASFPFTFSMHSVIHDNKRPVLFYREIPNMIPGYDLTQVLIVNGMVSSGIAVSGGADVTEFFFLNGIYVGYGVTRVFTRDLSKLEMQFQVFPQTSHPDYGRAADHPKMKGIAAEIVNRRLELLEELIPIGQTSEVVVPAHQLNQRVTADNPPSFYLNQLEKKFSPLLKSSPDGKPNYTGGLVLYLKGSGPRVEVRRSELRTEKVGETGEVTYDAENRITKITTLDGRVLLERSFEKTPDNEIVHETVYSYDAAGVPAGSVQRVYQTVDGVHRRLAAQLETENDPEFPMTSAERVMVLRGEKEVERRYNDAIRMLMKLSEKLQKLKGLKEGPYIPDVILRNTIVLLQKDLERFFFLKSGMASQLVRLLESYPNLDPTFDLFLVKAKALAGNPEAQAEMKRLLTGTGDALSLYVARSYAYLAGDKTIFELLFQSAREMEWAALVANHLSDEDLALVAEKVMTLSRNDPEQYAQLFLFLEKINDDRVADIVEGFLSSSDLGGFAYEVVSASIRYLGEHPADKYLGLLKDLTEKVSSEYQALIFEARMKMGDRTMIPEVMERFRELSTSDYPEENGIELETMMEILRDTHTKEALPDILRYFEVLLARGDELPAIGLAIYTLVSLGGEKLTREKVLPLLEKNMSEFETLSADMDAEAAEDSEPYRMIWDILMAIARYSETWILPYLQKLANRLTYVKLINGVDYAIQSIRARGNFNIDEDSPDAFEKNLLLLVNSLDVLASESYVGNGGRGGSLYYRTMLQSRKDLRERLITLIQQGAPQQGAAMRFLAMFPEDVRKLFDGTPVSRHPELKAALVEAILENSMNDIITNYSERYLSYENLISLKEKNVTFKEIDTAFLIKELLARGIVAEDREIRALIQKSPYFRLAGSVVLPKLEIMNVSYRGSRQKEAEDARYSTKAITVGLFNYRGSEKGESSGIPVLYEWDIQLMADKESFRMPDKLVALAFYYKESEFSLDTLEGRFLNNVFGVSKKASRPSKSVRKRAVSLMDKNNFEAVKELIVQQETERKHKGVLLGLRDRFRSATSAEEALKVFGADDTAPETMRGAVKMLKTKAGLLPAYVKFVYGHKDNGFDTIVEKVTELLRSGDLAGAKSLLDASYTIRFLEAEKKKIAGTIEDPSFELSSATGASATLKGTEDLPISSRIRRSDLRVALRTIALAGLMGVFPFIAEAAAKGAPKAIPRESIVKVQMKLGVDPVGVIGPKTIAALQKYGNFQIKSGKFDPQTKAIFDWVLRDIEGPAKPTKETGLPRAGKTLLTQISESLKAPPVSAPAVATQASKALTPEAPDIMPDEKLASLGKPATQVDEIVDALKSFNIIDAGMVDRVRKDANLRKELVKQLQKRLEVPSTGFFGNQTRKQVAVMKALSLEEASRQNKVPSGDMPVIVITKEGAQPVSPEDPVVKSLGIPAHAVLYKKLFEGFRDYGFKLWSVEKQKDLVTLGIVAELMTRDVLTAETKEEIETVRELAARQDDLGAMRMGISTVEGGKGLAVNQKGGPAASSEMIEPRSAIDAVRAAGFSKNPDVLSVLYDGLTKDQKAFVTSLLKKDANQDANRSKMWAFLQNSDFQNRVVILYLHWRLSIYKLPLPSSDNLQQQAGTYQIAWAPGIFEYPRTLGHFLYANQVYDVLEKLSRGDKLTDRDRKSLSQADSFSTRVETISTDMRKAQRAAMKKDFSKAKMLMFEAEQKYAKLLAVMNQFELVPERFMVTWKLRDEMDRRNTRLKAGLVPQTREGLPAVVDLRSMGMSLMPMAMTAVGRSELRKTGKSISGPMIASEKTPYRFDEFLNRGFANLNENLYGGKLLEEVEERLKTASGTLEVLLIGVGRGWEAIQLQKKYGSKIRVSAVNKERGLFLDEEGFKTWAFDNQVALTPEDREAFELVRKNLRILDVEKDLTSIKNLFDLAVMAYGVTEYLEDPVKVYNEILGSALKPGGALFGSLGDIRVAEAGGAKSGLSWMYRLPADSPLKQVGAGVRAPQGSSIPLRFERQEEMLSTDGITHFRSFYAPVRSDVREDKTEVENADWLDDPEMDSDEREDPPTETALHLPGYKHSFFPTAGFKHFWHGFKSLPFKGFEEKGKKQFWHRQDEGLKEEREPVDPMIVRVNNDELRPRIYLNPVDANNFIKAREVVRRVALSMGDRAISFKYLAEDFRAGKLLIDPSRVSPLVVTFLDSSDLQEFYKRMKADPEYRGIKGAGPTLMSENFLLEDQSVDQLACSAQGFVEGRIETLFANETVEQFVEKLGSLSVGDINRVLGVLDSLLDDQKKALKLNYESPHQLEKLEAAKKLLIQKKTVKISVKGTIAGTAPESLPVRMKLGGQDVFLDVELTPDERNYLITVWHDYGNVLPRTFVLPRGEDWEKIVGRSDVPTLSSELPSWLQRISRSQVKIRTMKDNTVVLEQMSPVASTAFVTSDPSEGSDGFVSRSAPPESQTRTFSLGRSWTNNGGEEMMLRIQFRLLYRDLLETTLLLNGMMLLSNDKPIRNVFSPESYNGTIVIGRTSSSPIVFPKELAQTLADSGVSGQHLDIVRWGSAWKIKPHKPQARVYEEGATLPLGDEGVSIQRSDVRESKEIVRKLNAQEQELLGVKAVIYHAGIFPNSDGLFTLNSPDVFKYAQNVSDYIGGHAVEFSRVPDLRVLQVGPASGTATLATMNALLKLQGDQTLTFDLVDIDLPSIENTRVNLENFFREKNISFRYDEKSHIFSFETFGKTGQVRLYAMDFLKFPISGTYQLVHFDSPVPQSGEEGIAGEDIATAFDEAMYEKIVSSMAERIGKKGRMLLGGFWAEDASDASLFSPALPVGMTYNLLGLKGKGEFSEDPVRMMFEILPQGVLPTVNAEVMFRHLGEDPRGWPEAKRFAGLTPAELGDALHDFFANDKSIAPLATRGLLVKKGEAFLNAFWAHFISTKPGAPELFDHARHYLDHAKEGAGMRGIFSSLSIDYDDQLQRYRALLSAMSQLKAPRSDLRRSDVRREDFADVGEIGLSGIARAESQYVLAEKGAVVDLRTLLRGMPKAEARRILARQLAEINPLEASGLEEKYLARWSRMSSEDLTMVFVTFDGQLGAVMDAKAVALGNTAEFEWVAVKTALPYKGVGTFMLDVLFQEVASRGVKFAKFTTNPGANGFYEQYFFELGIPLSRAKEFGIEFQPGTNSSDAWNFLIPVASVLERIRTRSSRAETRVVAGKLAGWVSVDQTDIGDPTKTRLLLKAKAEKELAKIGADFDASLSKLNGILGLMDAEQARNYLNSREFEDFMTREFRETLRPYFGSEVNAVVEQVVKHIRKLIVVVSVIGGGIGIKGFVDTAIPLIKTRDQGNGSIEEMSERLQSAIDQLSDKAGEHAIGVMTNHSGADSAAVLSMLERMTLERLIVLYPKEKPLGRAFNIPGVPLTPIPFEGTSSRSPAKRAQQALASGNGNTVALWTSDLDVGNTGIYTVIAEIGRIADPQLKVLALDAVRYIFLKYASSTPADQQKMLTHPELLRQDLDKMGFGAVVQLKGNVLVFDMQKLADMFAAKQSIEQAA